MLSPLLPLVFELRFLSRTFLERSINRILIGLVEQSLLSWILNGIHFIQNIAAAKLVSPCRT